MAWSCLTVNGFHELIIPDKHRHGATDGQFVVARITDYPSKRRKALAEVTEILGDVATPGIEIAIALRSFEIPHLWSAAVKKQTKALSQEVSAKDTIGRLICVIVNSLPLMARMRRTLMMPCMQRGPASEAGHSMSRLPMCPTM